MQLAGTGTVCISGSRVARGAQGLGAPVGAPGDDGEQLEARAGSLVQGASRARPRVQRGHAHARSERLGVPARLRQLERLE